MDKLNSAASGVKSSSTSDVRPHRVEHKSDGPGPRTVDPAGQPEGEHHVSHSARPGDARGANAELNPDYVWLSSAIGEHLISDLGKLAALYLVPEKLVEAERMDLDRELRTGLKDAEENEEIIAEALKTFDSQIESGQTIEGAMRISFVGVVMEVGKRGFKDGYFDAQKR